MEKGSPTAHQHSEAQLLKSFAQEQLIAVDCKSRPISSGRNNEPAVEDLATGQIPKPPGRWRRVISRWPRIGLIGFNTDTGLGSQNRDIADQIPITRWLIRPHPQFANHSPVRRFQYETVVLNEPSDAELRQWLSGLDWILFVETPLFARITTVAKACGVRVAAVCNWEWTCLLRSSWLRNVDLLICPTLHTWQIMNDWKARFFFSWQIIHIPWPINLKHFTFRARRRCESFVFINGTGGAQARNSDGTLTLYHRKGIEVILEAARIAPHVPIVVYSQRRDLPSVPPNVQLRKAPSDNSALYSDGDVCVQPSHWEGLGLQLLECQAAGMPLITTNAPPMKEHQPMRTVPVSATQFVHLAGETPIASSMIDPADLAAVLCEVHGSDIEHHSVNARRFIEENHVWSLARQHLRVAMANGF
jgi:glycosyltransferase involved in cell wall biosynthesis